MKEQKDYIINLFNFGDSYSYRLIAEMTNNEFDTDYWDGERVRDTIRKYKKKEEIEKINNITVSYTENNSLKIKNNRIMVMTDWHHPFHREDILDIIKKHRNEIDALIVGGDAMNNESLSKFLELNKMTFEEEITGFYEFVSEIRNILPLHVKIIFIRGNHEYRLYRTIASMHEKQLSKFINPEVIQMLVDGFTIYEHTKQTKYDPIPNVVYIPHWFVNINDELIVAHPEEFSKVPVKTVVNAIDYFYSRNETFSTVIIGHLHKFGEVKKNGKYGIQLGCLCKPQKYADKGSFTYSPQDYNYAIITFDNNGKVDKNQSKIYHLEELYSITEKEINYKIKL